MQWPKRNAPEIHSIFSIMCEKMVQKCLAHWCYESEKKQKSAGVKNEDILLLSDSAAQGDAGVTDGVGSYIRTSMWS